jgi:hypothetical protein
MKKANRQRPVRGFWDWVSTGSWDGNQDNAGGQHG